MLDRPDAKTTEMIELPDSLEAINDHFYLQGWTDGLPIIPPTSDRVDAMLAGMSWRDADDVFGRGVHDVVPAVGPVDPRSADQELRVTHGPEL